MLKTGIGIVALSLLAACSGPLEKIERIDAVELDDDAAVQAALEAQQPAGTRPILQKLLGPPPGEADTVESIRQAPSSDVASTVGSDTVALATVASEESKPRGLRNLFKRKQADVGNIDAPAAGDDANVVLAYVPAAEPEARPRRPKPFGHRKKLNKGPDALDVEPGTPLAFGTIARVCGIKRGDLGKEVERSGRGKGKYRLHDTAPGSASPRAFYVTGFDDGCPRQMTGALALFSEPKTYEHLRTTAIVKTLSTGEADDAYIKARRKTCRAQIGKPCVARKEKKLARETAFITVYERFGSSANWRDILLHDGAVLAMD